MSKIIIDLQDGFDNDQVIIQIDHQEVYRKENVSTQLLLGFADSVTTEAPTDPFTVTVEVLSRSLTQEIPLVKSEIAYLGLSLTGSSLVYLVSDHEFWYG